MTDREDLDDQIWRTFVGCGVAGREDAAGRLGRGAAGRSCDGESPLRLQPDPQVQPAGRPKPYSERDDIIVISDEAHRTQAGKFARNMRLALPNASFIGFTGTPLFKHDELTKRIFGDYVSRYDFKRSEEDQSTVKLVYENRGEKLGIARLDLNDRIADAIEEAELDPDQAALLEKLLGKDYEVITADDRLDKLADDFVEHCSTRWETGQVDAGLHRQDHLRPDVPAHRAALEGEARRRCRRCIPGEGSGAGRGRRPGRAGAPRQGARKLRGAGAVDGEHDHRDHHQRSAERGRATSRSGASTSSRIACVMKTGLRDARRQAGAMSRTPSRTRSIRSASPSSAPCG